MSERKYRNTDEITIDLADLCKWLSRRWLIILAVCLAGGAAGGAVSYYRSKPASIDSLREALSAEETSNVEKIYDVYSAKQRQMEDAATYIADSAILQMNSNAAPKIVSSYTITTDIPHVWEIYDSTVLRDTDLLKIAEILDLKSPEYASEMVSVSGYSSDNLISAGSASTGIMTVKVYGYSKEEAQKINKTVSDRIDEVTRDLEKSNSGIAVEKQGSVYTEGYDRELSDLQQKAISAPSDLQNSLQTYRASYVDKLSSEEKEYFDALCDIHTETETPAKPAILGGLIGLILACAAYTIEYLCAGVIRTADEAEQIFDTLVIGTVGQDADAYDLSVPLQQIHALAAASKNKKVFLQSDSETSVIADHLRKMMIKIDKTVQVNAGNALKDAESCQQLVEADVVIACSAIGQTRKDKLEALQKMIATVHPKTEHIGGVILLAEN